MNKQTKEFAVWCNLRMEIMDKLEKAIKNKDKNEQQKRQHQLQYIDEKIKELQK